MAIAFRSAGTAVEVNATSLTVSYTLTAGDLLCFLVGIAGEAAAPTSVVWNTSENMSLVHLQANASGRDARLYVLAGGTSGTHDVVITYAASEPMAGVAFGMSGVATTTPTDGATGAGAGTPDAAPSVSVTSPTGDYALAGIVSSVGAGTTLTMTNGTKHSEQDTSNFGLHICGRDGQGGATQVNGTFSADPFGWTIAACNLNVPAVFGAGHLGHYYRSVVTESL